MSTKKNKDVNIEQEFKVHIEKLEKQIGHIETKELEINSMISTIKASTDNVELLIAQENDNKQKGKFYTIISRNVELMNNLYNTYQSFESVKHKYYQDMGKMNVYKVRMLEIELKQIDLRFNNIKSDDLFVVNDSLLISILILEFL